MTGAKILVVEDERIVAADLQNTLTRLGYVVPMVAASGEEALRAVAEHSPDLVLMDIRLPGGMDGIVTTRQIRERVDVPVVYVTAFSDVDTLRRANVTEPDGYVLKPVEERDLHTTIGIAFYRHAMQRRLRESEERLAATLRSITDGVIAFDNNGSISLLNSGAERLTGWRNDDAVWKDVAAVLNLVDERTRQVAPSLMPAIRAGAIVGVVQGLLLLDAKGRGTPVEIRAAPTKDERGRVVGALLVVRDLSDQRRAEEAERQAEALRAVMQLATAAAHEIDNPLAVVMGTLELVARKRAVQGALRKDIEAVIAAARRIHGIVDHMQRISHPDVGDEGLGLPAMLDLRKSSADPGSDAPGSAG